MLKLFSFVILSLFAFNAHAVEEWKGEPTSGNMQLSVLSGLGSYTKHGGFSLVGGAGFKVAPNGFLDDVNEVGVMEFQLGHTFVEGNDPWPYSFHFRWDFQKNIDWTFFALGGLGGHFGSDHVFSNEWVIHPRFGVGAIWSPFVERASVRFELDADKALVGMQFDF